MALKIKQAIKGNAVILIPATPVLPVACTFASDSYTEVLPPCPGNQGRINYGDSKERYERLCDLISPWT